METKNKSHKKYNADTLACIQSAYEDLQLMIEEIFINIKGIPNQLSIKEFATIFTKFDWQDIIIKVEDLDFLNPIENQKSVYKFLSYALNEDKSIEPINDITDNSYIQENN